MVDFWPLNVSRLIVKKVPFHTYFGHLCVEYHTWVPTTPTPNKKKQQKNEMHA